jgi:hypothetical protein
MGKLGGFGMVVYGLVFRIYRMDHFRNPEIVGSPLKVAGSPICEVAGFFGASLGFVLDSNPMAGKGRKLSYFDVPGTALSWDPAMAAKLGVDLRYVIGDSV